LERLPKDRQAEADTQRRSILLDALLTEIRYTPAIINACYRWERKLRMRDAETIFQNLRLHYTAAFAAECYAEALRRATATWRTAAFQRDATKTLKKIGFPHAVALRLAPPAFELYLAWAADRPMPPPRRPGAPVRGRRGGNLQLWAHYFYFVDVIGWSVHGFVKAFHLGMHASAHAHFPGADALDAPRRSDAYWPRFDCNCRKALKDALKETRRLLEI
jgi:hypothetical protein